MSNKITLEIKLRRIFLLAGGIILVFYFCTEFLKEYYYAKEKSLATLVTFSDPLARNIMAPILFNDLAEVNQQIRLFSTQNNVLSVTVFDSAGAIIANAGAPPLAEDIINLTTPKTPIIENGIITIKIFLSEKGQNAGILIVHANANIFQKSFYLNLTIYTAAFFAIMFFSLLLGNRLIKNITDQVKDFEAMAKKLTQIGLDQITHEHISQKMPMLTDFEHLHQSFQEMIEKIVEQRDIIRNNNENLEKKIAEKTLELDEERKHSILSAKFSAIGELSGQMAHEINNPLTILMMNSALIAKRINSENFNKEEVTELIKLQQATITRMSKIITGLRNLSRDENNSEREIVSIHDVFNEIHLFCDHKLKQYNIKLLFENQHEIEQLTFLGQRIPMIQVFVILINNSIYAACNIENIDRWIKVNCTLNDNQIDVDIVDCGGGISQEIVKKLFTPFFTTKPRESGTGLGLNIAKTIVERNNGTISYIPGQNTCFRLSLQRP